MKKRRKLLLRMIFSIILFGYLLVSIDWRQIEFSLCQIRPVSFLGVVFFILAAVGVSIIKWGLILDTQGIRISLKQLWDFYWIGLFFNNFLPSSIGGDGIRIIKAGQISGNMSGAAYSVILERILATLGLSALGLIAPIFTDKTYPLVSSLFCILLVTGILLIGLMLWGKKPKFIVNRSDKFCSFISGFIDNGILVRKKPGAVFLAFFWSVVFQLANVAVNYAIFWGMGVNVSFIQAMYLVPAAAAISMIPLGINGYGLRESAYVFLLSPLGVARASAFTVSVLFAFSVSICSLWGGILWLVSVRKGEQHNVTDESFENSTGCNG